MAGGETYPKISRKLWWLLRDRLKQSVPSTISTTLISALSPMTDASARSNVLSPMRQLGLLDDGNKPTEIAERWRHDDEYEKVCHEIRQKVYPHELIEAFPEATDNQRDSIKKWFMKVGQVGEGAAGKFTDTYMLLSDADLTKASEKASADSVSKPIRSVTKPKPLRTPTVQTQPKTSNSSPQIPPLDPDHSGHGRRMPAIHIDVQVHISPDTPPEQIDRIFESMAKHLGGFVK